MSNYKISRIYLDNYKLFNQKELVFMVFFNSFDGPMVTGKQVFLIYKSCNDYQKGF